MTVMQRGFNEVTEINHGASDTPDRSRFMGSILNPCVTRITGKGEDKNSEENALLPMFKLSTFDREYRSNLGYHQPASPLSSVGIMPAGSGSTSSKYGARRQIPQYFAENCTQCMTCIGVCPDTALPNTAQDVTTILRTSIPNYVSNEGERNILLEKAPEIETAAREKMLAVTVEKDGETSFHNIVMEQVSALKGSGISQETVDEMSAIVEKLPMSFHKVRAIFQGREKKARGTGGLFSIFINDLCKGCSACVEACGDHDALRMVEETEELNAQYHSATQFMDLLHDTPQKYLGLFDASNPQEAKAATLRYHLMLQSKYSAFASGDGACAGCGEKIGSSINHDFD